MKLLVFLLPILMSCATTPEGRTQLAFMPDDQMNSMGAQSFDQIKKETPVSSDKRKITYVGCITNLLLQQMGENPSSWEVRVFESKEINAFALPGKKVGVYTGIMDVAETAGQLAAVIGHEIGHVISRHGNERVSQSLLMQGGLVAVSAALDPNNKNNGLLLAAMGAGAQFGVLMPFGRKQESEADMIGLDVMAKSGFDPRESVKLWQNMSRKAGGGGPEWLSTHPSHDTRIRDLQSRMDRAMGFYQQSVLKDDAAKCVRNW